MLPHMRRTSLDHMLGRFDANRRRASSESEVGSTNICLALRAHYFLIRTLLAVAAGCTSARLSW